MNEIKISSELLQEFLFNLAEVNNELIQNADPLSVNPVDHTIKSVYNRLNFERDTSRINQ